MANAYLSIRIECPVDSPPLLSVVGSDGRRLALAVEVEVHEPVSSAQLAAITKRVVSLWYEPEIGSDGSEGLLNYLRSTGHERT